MKNKINFLTLILVVILSVCTVFCSSVFASPSASDNTRVEVSYVDVVKLVQSSLNKAGFDCGTPDGSAGPSTQAAINSFKKSKGLEENGLIDDALIDALGIRAEAHKITVLFESAVKGSGDDVIDNINPGSGMYKVHFTHNGNRNFAVWVYDKYDDRDLVINTIGNYDGYILLSSEAPYTFEINADGQWSFVAEEIGVSTDTVLSGHGDYVSDKLSGVSSGTWEFNHTGSSNFAVWAYTTKGRDLLINEIGNYSGRVRVNVPSDSLLLFEIEADGDWTASPKQ